MDVKPRKLPRQARAKATVDAIIEASIQVLMKEGYERFTTARVAERAGASVGSLYQYFPNKAALASASIDRCRESYISALQSALASRRRVTLHECVRAIVDVTLISHQLLPGRLKIVLDLAPRIGAPGKAEAFSRTAVQGIEQMLRKHTDEIAPGIDIIAAATIISTLLEALAHRAAISHPVRLDNDLLASETTRFIYSYLTHG